MVYIEVMFNVSSNICKLLEFYDTRTLVQVSDVADMPYVNLLLPRIHFSMKSTHNNIKLFASDQDTDD